MAFLKRSVLSLPSLQMRHHFCACTNPIATQSHCFSTSSKALATNDRITWKAAAAASHASHGSHHDAHHHDAAPEYYQGRCDGNSSSITAELIRWPIVITPGFYRKFFSIVGFTTLFAMQHAYFTRLDEVVFIVLIEIETKSLNGVFS